MNDALNARLVGRTFTNEIGERITVADSIIGLAPGYVTVVSDSGRKSHEHLHYILRSLDPAEDDLVAAMALLASAERLKEYAIALASRAASVPLSDGAVQAMLDFDSGMDAATEMGSRAVEQGEEIEATPSRPGLR